MMKDGQERGAGRKFIPVGEVFAKWGNELEFRAAYDALEEEFALVSALIQARLDIGITQEQVPRLGNDPSRDR